MANETANRAAEALMPAGLLDPATAAGLFASTMPALIVAADGQQVLWASREGARRLGQGDAVQLMAQGLPRAAAGSRRLAALAQDIAPTAARRLERLRFSIGFSSSIVTALCEPLRLADSTTALLVSLIDARPGRNDAAQSAAAELPPAAPLPDPDDIAAIIADAPVLPAPDAPAKPLAEVPAAAAAAEPPAITAPAWAGAPDAAIRPLRFVFALDAGGRVQSITSPFAEAVGAANADIVGADLADHIAAFDADAARALRAAIASGATWNGLFVRWPVAGTSLAVPIEFSALPAAAADNGRPGFSGFGRCHLGRAITITIPAPAEAAIEAPAAAIAPPAERDRADEPASPPADTQRQAPVAPSEPAPAPLIDPDLEAAIAAFGAPEAEASAAAQPPPSIRPDAEAGAFAPPEPPIRPASQAGAPAREPAGAAALPFEPIPFPRPAPAAQNVVEIKTGQPPVNTPTNSKAGLSLAERNAFREIARALGAKFDPDLQRADEPDDAGAAGAPAAPGGADHPPPRAEAAETGPPPLRAARPDRPIFADLLDQLPIGILVLHGDAMLFANRTLIDLTGYPDLPTFAAEDGARAIFRKGSLPRDREAGFDTVVLTTRSGEMLPVDAHLQFTDWGGTNASLLCLRRAVEIEQGKALRSVALDLKRVRNEAHELRAVLDTATDGVVTLDDRGRILSLNGAAEALFGLSQNEVAGESFTALLLNESHADALDYFEGLRSNGVRSVLNDGRDVFGREKKGGRIPLFMTLGRITEEEPRRFCAVLRDLTAWKRAEAELTEARRAAELASAKKSDFLTKISHEIRTPMNAIIGFAEVMAEERLGPIGTEKYKEYLGDIRTSGKHVVSLVNDLLDLAKIEAGRMEMNFAATDLNAVVASSVGIIQPQANASRVLVRTQLAQKMPKIVADERSMRQILLNMLSNATRFTESGGQVIIATALLDSGEAVLRIRDTGVGMTATEIEQALEPFRQVGTRRDHGGTGLGLPLTRALVEANRANFAIRSTPGEGTMIEITFPSTRVLAE